MNYEFHPEAELELHESALRYEAAIRCLGRQFRDEVERVVQMLLENPDQGARLDNSPLRHFVLRRFPFSIVYAVMPDLISIVAIEHGSREPNYWQWRVHDR